jgi:ABC-type multidrug transport system fused ATPase/permease subunit
VNKDRTFQAVSVNASASPAPILRDPSILIMDEATSMIDAESEVNIAEAVAEFGAGRTCLIVAHRQATIQSCDHVVVMEAGRIIDQGAHDELLARCEAYRVIRGAH